ncbi:MAG: class I SAM-dependent methyltransferase [Gemmatimonadaceae bacterium]
MSEEREGEVVSGELVTADKFHRYPIRDSIPRFVPAKNYAENFGIQWNRFRGTQLDSVSGLPISRERFYGFSRWNPAQLAGKLVLDVGCGAGRFAEIALQAGARVVALDYSSAVDACWSNLSAHKLLSVVQGDIFALPFAVGQFDFVYCFGVLQHTPDPEGAFRSLPPHLRPGGRLAVDIYPWLVRNLGWSKYWLRPVTKRMSPQTLFGLVKRTTSSMLAASRVLGRVPAVGRYLRYLVPVVSYDGVYPLSSSQLYEWAVLDTFDMLAPAHDHPQQRSALVRWFTDAGLENFTVERLGFLVGRGNRPLESTTTDKTAKRSEARKRQRKVGTIDSLGRTNLG